MKHNILTTTVNPGLTAEGRFRLLMDAPAHCLRRIDEILLRGPSPVEPDGNSRLLTVTQAAKALGVSRPSIYSLIRRGRLASVDIGLSSARIREADIHRLAAGGMK